MSWRFKELDQPWPLVLVTTPADRRLAVEAAHAVVGECAVRALVLGDAAITRCEVRADDGPWQPMRARPEPGRYEARLSLPAAARHVFVRATDARGRTDAEGVALLGADDALPASCGPGSDADHLGAWPEKGVLGTQLGPNRNGRAW